MKNSYITLLAFLFLLIGQRALGESVTKKVHFNLSELRCDTITGGDGQVYSLLAYPQLDSEEELGFPALPIKFIPISLPYIADDISVTAKSITTTSYSLNYKIYPRQDFKPSYLGNVEKIFIPCEKSVYESTSTYPLKTAKISEISCAGHGDRNVVVAVYPVVYSPSENRIDFSEDVEIAISYILSAQRQETLNRSTQIVDIGIPFYE